MQRLKSNNSYLKSGIKLTIALIMVAISIAIYFNRQFIVDSVVVWRYQPSVEIENIIDRSGVNEKGRFIYLASEPVLESTQAFNDECRRIENTVSILGCYTGNRIYIYNVTDPELDGVREVTAAHELLHAVYARLSDKEKSKLESLLEAEYKKIEKNNDYADRMDFYAETEPGERVNELHSVIGTEISEISPELEAHYSQYFKDRQAVVKLSEKYNGVFRVLSAQADELASSIDNLSSLIDSQSEEYNQKVDSLNNEIEVFNERASSGYFDSQFQFQVARNQLLARVDGINELKNSIDSNINKYEAAIADYNSIATQTQKLYNSIDSTLAPPASID